MNMRKYGNIFNCLVLVALGLAFGWYVLFGEYWRLLNPKFQWLTGAAAFSMLLLGLSLLGKGSAPLKLSRMACLAAIVGVFLVDSSATVVNPSPRDAFDGKSRLTWQDQEYIKLNIGELYLLVQKIQPDIDPEDSPVLKNRYVLRAVVKHHPELKKNGQFMLMRAVVWCCLADATGTGFRVPYDNLDLLPDGAWVQVYARLQKLPKRAPAIYMLLDKTRVSWINPDFILVPDRIVKVSPPDFPYIFERETKEPYNY
jgi:hypothetical protein